MRFAIRPAVVADAEGIARAHAASWETSYRTLLPAHVLARMALDQRATSWARVIRDPALLALVAYDTTHGDIVGLCDAGRNRGPTPHAGEVYRLYFVHHARRHGLGREMFEHVATWLRARRMGSLVIWVLADNEPARRFYEALGGVAGPQIRSSVAGFPVVEQAYGWDAL